MEEIIEKIYTKIKKFILKVEKDNFTLNLNGKIDDNNSTIEKLNFIENFIKIHLEEKKKYFTHSNYEIITLNENIEKLLKSDHFNQENFKNVIEKCKILMKFGREDKLYIERLKQEIIILEKEKNAVVEKTKQIIIELKNDNLNLIYQMKKLNNEKEKIIIIVKKILFLVTKIKRLTI